MKECLWIGTEQHQEWFPTPLSGADTSPVGYADGGTGINGEGYQYSSSGSHREYQFSWSNASAREVAEKLQNYADGVYGDGKLYVVDTTMEGSNLVNQRWSKPFVSTDAMAPTLITGVRPKKVSASIAPNGPIYAAQYDLSDDKVGRDSNNEVYYYQPVPSGKTYSFVAWYTGTNAGVYTSPDNSTWTKRESGEEVSFTSAFYVKIFRSSLDEASITFQGMRVWNKSASRYTGWGAGMGSNGCRVAGKPTFVQYNMVGGGQYGFAATLREVDY